jgi:hypothetical protein
VLRLRLQLRLGLVRENKILNWTELCVPTRLVIQDCVCVWRGLVTAGETDRIEADRGVRLTEEAGRFNPVSWRQSTRGIRHREVMFQHESAIK